MSTTTIRNVVPPLTQAIRKQHLAQPTGRIFLLLATEATGEEANTTQRADIERWMRLVGPNQICAYDSDSREGWWLVDREPGETGWFRLPPR